MGNDSLDCLIVDLLAHRTLNVLHEMVWSTPGCHSKSLILSLPPPADCICHWQKEDNASRALLPLENTVRPPASLLLVTSADLCRMVFPAVAASISLWPTHCQLRGLQGKQGKILSFSQVSPSPPPQDAAQALEGERIGLGCYFYIINTSP